MLKITTKMGDKGETSLFGGKKVKKSSPFIEIVGDLDELQSFLGWCRVGEGAEFGSGSGAESTKTIEQIGQAVQQIAPVIDKIQEDLYRMMAIAGFEMKCPQHIKDIDEEDVKFLEDEGEKYAKLLEKQVKFIKPGSTEAAARFHIARSVCRRVERNLVKRGEDMMRDGGTDEREGDRNAPEHFIKYLNRLSDLLFAIAYSFEKEIRNC